jgi:hypothetical protein
MLAACQRGKFPEPERTPFPLILQHIPFSTLAQKRVKKNSTVELSGVQSALRNANQ